MKSWLPILLGIAVIQICGRSQEQQPDRELKTLHERSLAVLKFIAHRQKNYGLIYLEKLDSDSFKIDRHDSLICWKLDWIMKVGEISPDKDFRIDGYDGKVVSITFLSNGREIKLGLNEKINIPIYYAQFRQSSGVEGEEKDDFYVKKGDSFKFSTNSKLEYTLVDIEPEKVVLSFWADLGKEKKVEIKIEK